MGRKVGVGRAEAEVLRFVSEGRTVTARETAEHFAVARGWAKTTTLSVLDRLRGKGFINRESSEDGIFRYAPATPKARMLRELVRDFVDEMLGGSLEPVAAYLAQRAEVSDAELEDLKAVVAALEERKAATQETKAEEK